MIITKTFQDLKPVLFDPANKQRVKEAYSVIKTDDDGNITILASGKNGQEYNKTFGFVQRNSEVEVYHCLFGQGMILMQRFNDETMEAREFRIHSLRPGTTIEVPAGYAAVLVNTGPTILAVWDNAKQGAKHHDYEVVKSKKGLAYYVVEKKGEIAFDRNMEYRYPPQITT